KSTCCDCVYYRAEGQYGWILDGDVRRSDQLAEAATGPLTSDTFTCVNRVRRHNHIHNRYVADFNAAIGYPLDLCLCDGLQLIPTLGFAYDIQKIRYKNRHPIDSSVLDRLDFSSCESCDCSSESISSSSSCRCTTHSSFRSTWWGPFIGLDFCYNHQDCW